MWADTEPQEKFPWKGQHLQLVLQKTTEPFNSDSAAALSGAQ